MKRGFSVFGLMALMGLLVSGLSAPVAAQQGGSGGGGGNGGGGNSGSSSPVQHGGKYNIIWDTPQSINGKMPKSVGSVSISTYVTTLSLDARLSSINLPDNTQLTVTVYANDLFTGLPWTPKVAGIITLAGQSGSLTIASLWVTAAGKLPSVTSVVVTQADGTVVVSGHL